MDTFERLATEIARVQAEAADVLGAVVATPEGLLLVGAGSLGTDTSAATASHLADLLDSNLSMLLGTSCTDALLWTPSALWGLARLSSQHVVLVQAAVHCSAGTLRLALGRLRRDLAPALQELQTGQ